MRLFKIIVGSILIIYSFLSCIEPFDSEEYSSVKSIVVDALITDEDELQTITLSRSTFTIDPVWDPISNANVIVIDKGNNVFDFLESTQKKGVYEGIIGKEFLVPGNAFKVSFTTREGNDYESNFQELLACPKVDSVYYEINNEHYVQGVKLPERGLEFFLDLKAKKENSSYYRWQLDETYEFHATWPIEKYWMNEWRTIYPDYKYFVGYKTDHINSIFLGSTSSLDENVYLKLPLNFVNNQTQRLYFRYSLLVKQLSMTKQAYLFWEALKNNNQTSGGLFDSQPIKVKGNIVSLSNPNEIVLGYFGVSSVQTKRISISDFRGLIYDYNVFCIAQFIPPQNAGFITRSESDEWPIYVAPTPDGEPEGVYYAKQECFDCRLAGGSLEVPEFWGK